VNWKKQPFATVTDSFTKSENLGLKATKPVQNDSQKSEAEIVLNDCGKVTLTELGHLWKN
jgi:hypothetical protein